MHLFMLHTISYFRQPERAPKRQGITKCADAVGRSLFAVLTWSVDQGIIIHVKGIHFSVGAGCILALVALMAADIAAQTPPDVMQAIRTNRTYSERVQFVAEPTGLGSPNVPADEVIPADDLRPNVGNLKSAPLVNPNSERPIWTAPSEQSKNKKNWILPPPPENKKEGEEETRPEETKQKGIQEKQESGWGWLADGVKERNDRLEKQLRDEASPDSVEMKDKEKEPLDVHGDGGNNPRAMLERKMKQEAMNGSSAQFTPVLSEDLTAGKNEQSKSQSQMIIQNNNLSDNRADSGAGNEENKGDVKADQTYKIGRTWDDISHKQQDAQRQKASDSYLPQTAAMFEPAEQKGPADNEQINGSSMPKPMAFYSTINEDATKMMPVSDVGKEMQKSAFTPNQDNNILQSSMAGNKNDGMFPSAFAPLQPAAAPAAGSLQGGLSSPGASFLQTPLVSKSPIPLQPSNPFDTSKPLNNPWSK